MLFVSVDDMNDWVGCLGGYPACRRRISTHSPNAESLSNAHCAAPLCNPSRTALLTGLRPSTTGIYNNEQYWRPNLPNVVSMPAYFKKNGYHVAGVGKVFHHVAGFNSPPDWDEFQLQVFDDPWYRRTEWYPWVKKIPAPEGHPFNGLKNFQGEFDWGVLPKPEAEYGDMKASRLGQPISRAQTRQTVLPRGRTLASAHPDVRAAEIFDLYPEEKVHIPEDAKRRPGRHPPCRSGVRRLPARRA